MRDWRRIRRIFSAVCLILGPALFCLGILIRPSGSDETGEELLAYVRSNGAIVHLHDLMSIAAIFLLVPALIGAMHVLRSRAPLLGYLGGGLALVGFVSLFGMIALDGVALDMVRHGGSQADMAAVLDRAMNQDPILITMTMVFVVGHIVGATLLGIGLYRARIVTLWSAAAVAVSQPMHFIAHGVENKPLDVVAFALFAVGLATLGVRMLRMHDAEWDAEPASVPPGASAPRAQQATS
jgi:hypothetical protein